MVVAMATTGRRWVEVFTVDFLPQVTFSLVSNKNRDLPFGDDSIFRKKQYAHEGMLGVMFSKLLR